MSLQVGKRQMLGLMGVTSSHKSHLGAGLGTCMSSPWAGPAPGGQWVRLFQTQGGRLGCGPHFIHSERRRDTGSLNFLFFLHLKSYGSLCFYSEGKGAELSFLQCASEDKWAALGGPCWTFPIPELWKDCAEQKHTSPLLPTPSPPKLIKDIGTCEKWK